MTSRELTARQKKNSHDKGERGIKSQEKKVDSCLMTGFGVWFLSGMEEDSENGGKRRAVRTKTVSTLASLSKLQQHLTPTPQQPHGNSN